MTTGLTVVMPAFNSAGTIGAALESIRSQTLRPDQVIVVDDGSSDQTAVVAERAGARVIRQPNGGPGAARNTGIRAAETPWIALLDADDIALPNRFEVEHPWTADPAVGIICSRHRVPGLEPPSPPPLLDFDTLWTRNWIPTSTVLLRRSAWESVGGFDERRDLLGAEDYNFWLRLTHAGWRVASLMDVLVEYRPTPESITGHIARCAAGELVNIEAIGTALGLPAERLRAKQHGVYREYGVEFFHYRQLKPARRYLREAVRRGPLTLGEWVRLVATWLPLKPRD